jgi:hypothetical protein
MTSSGAPISGRRRQGEVVVFNRSHYEDVLVVRVHDLVPKAVWSKRYALINDFEKMLVQNGTRILKFFLHISPEEQLARFKQRLDDPARNWKISESDYSERELWSDYVTAYEEALSRTSTKERAVVRHSGQPQVVPQPRHLADHRRHDGRDGTQAAADAGEPAGNRRQVSRCGGSAEPAGR